VSGGDEKDKGVDKHNRHISHLLRPSLCHVDRTGDHVRIITCNVVYCRYVTVVEWTWTKLDTPHWRGHLCQALADLPLLHFKTLLTISIIQHNQHGTTAIAIDVG
jgi:hypothetical protein